MSGTCLPQGLPGHASSGMSCCQPGRMSFEQNSQHGGRAPLGLQAFLQQRRAEMASPSYETLASGLPSAYRDTAVEQVKAMLSAVKVGARASCLLESVLGMAGVGQNTGLPGSPQNLRFWGDISSLCTNRGIVQRLKLQPAPAAPRREPRPAKYGLGYRVTVAMLLLLRSNIPVSSA